MLVNPMGIKNDQGNLGGENLNPYIITSILFVVSLFLIWLFSGEGKASKIIDGVIKGLVAIIVLSFMGVVITLGMNGAIDWSALFTGLVPDFSALFNPVDSYDSYLDETGDYRPFWEEYISNSQNGFLALCSLWKS